MPTSLLQEKHAVVFGGGGSIGAAVAKQLAADGAEVFLAGRTAPSVEAVAKQIEAAGGRAHAEVVDALDATAVGAYVASVAQQAGGLDIEFNATGPPYTCSVASLAPKPSSTAPVVASRTRRTRRRISRRRAPCSPVMSTFR